MASPFKVFRKNQKAALAVLTIVAMGGFVVFPTLIQLIGSGGNRSVAREDVVTTTRYGNLDNEAMSRLRSDRQAVLQFLSTASRYVRAEQPMRQTLTVADQLQRQLPTEDENIVETWLLVKHAEELGVVVDEKAVNKFVQQITEGVVAQTQLAQLLKDARLTENQLIRLLQYEMTAMRVYELANTGLMPTTPGQRWDYYKRLNRQMSIELAEVPVGEFQGKVADPDEATLVAFFDKYKDKEDIPSAPEPGFMVPQQIAIEYFKVDYDHLFAEGELEKYYEEHKEEFKRELLPEMEMPEPTSELRGSLPGLDVGPLMTPAIEGDKPEVTESEAAETEGVEPEATPPKEESKEEPAPAEEAQETPAEEKTATEEPKVEDEPSEEQPEEADQSKAARRSLFQLAAYQAEEDEEKPAEEKQEEPTVDPPAEEKPEPKPEEPKEAAEEAKPAEEPKTEPAAEEPTETPVEPAEEEPLSEYYPFDEVKSQIQNRLAPEKLDKLFVPLENMMTIYHDAQVVFIREQDADGNATTDPPTKPDFKSLAGERGIEAKRTELFSRLLLDDMDIGSSSVTWSNQPVAFGTFAFDSLSMHRPARSQDSDGNYYLFWKTEQEEQRVPELAAPGIRKMVVGAWKMIEARSATEAEAKELAALAGKKGTESLTVTLAGKKIGEKPLTIESSDRPFAWFDPMFMQFAVQGYAMPRLSTIELVTPEPAQPAEGEEAPESTTLPLAGVEFMRAVSGLETGEVGIAWNVPKTVVYVVRMVETSPEPELLRQQFHSAANPQQMRIVADLDRGEAFHNWMNGLKASVGFEMK